VIVKKGIAVVAVALVVVAAAWYLLASRQTEDARIRKRLNELTELISDSAGASGQDLLIQPVRLGKFFTENVVITIGERLPEIRGRDHLVAMAQAAFSRETTINVSFEDIDVTVNSDKRHALVIVNVLVTGASSDEARSVSTRQLELDMTKVDGEWLIQAVRPIEVFELDY